MFNLVALMDLHNKCVRAHTYLYPYVHAPALFVVVIGVITADDVISEHCRHEESCSKQSLRFTYSYAGICCQGNKVTKGCVHIPLNSMEVVREWEKKNHACAHD